ncbi:MAG: hypothetical protein ACLFWD_02940 [Anaerolineales bacterium]
MTEQSGAAGSPSYDRCRQVLREYEPELLALPNVIGVGVGESEEGDLGLVLLLREPPGSEFQDWDEPLPTSLAGVPIWHRPIGSVRPQGGEVDPD